MRRIRALLGHAVALAVLSLSSCSRQPTAPAVEVGPLADSPAAAVRSFEWAVNHREAARLDGLLTDDFRWRGIAMDSAGNSFVDPARWTRQGFLDVLQRLFQGDTTQGPAQALALGFDRTLISSPDPAPGRTPEVNRVVRTTVDFRTTLADGNTYEVTGYALFHLVRGDSASIPPERLLAGDRPDAARWWIREIEDETLGEAGGFAPNPSRLVNWTEVLRIAGGR